MTSPRSRTKDITVRWAELLGDDLLGFDDSEIQALNNSLFQHSPRSLRLGFRISVDELPFPVQQVPWYRTGYWLSENSHRPGAYLQFAAGDYYIQDAASMLALALCSVRPGQLVCDLCAAPGGKSTGLLDQMQGEGLLLANEVIHSRMPLLQAALCRSGWDNFATSQLDADHLSQFLPGQFDSVLVDAPCSGQSMVGREKQSLAAFSTDQIELNAARQRRILRAAAQLVKPGGRLVYSTCTFAVAENEEIIEGFLEQFPHWQLTPIAGLEPWQSPRLPGSYRLWPHRHQCDGGFAAVLRPNQDSQFVSESFDLLDNHLAPVRRTSRTNKSHSAGPMKLEELSEFLVTCDDPQVANAIVDEHYQRIQLGDQLHLLKRSSIANIQSVICGAIPVAQRHTSRVEPLYGSAVVPLRSMRAKQNVHLNEQQAIAYVRGESVTAVDVDGQSGWCQVCWNNRPLAWGKRTGTTIKNHLPKLLRNPSVNAW